MRGVIFGAGALALGLALMEVAMQPTNTERIELGVIFALMVILMAVGARWLPGQARRNRSLRATVTLLSLLALLVVTAGAVAIANRMFLSQHDLTLLLVILSFGVLSALGFGLTVSRPLTADLDEMSHTAAEVAQGILDGQVDIERNDEVGRLGTALDTMTARLRQAGEARAADAEARRAFFAAVGHDLRTPLSSLQAALEAIQDGVVTDTGRYLGSMEKDIAALSRLVEDIFLLARLDAGSIELERVSVDVAEVVDEAIDVLAPLASEHDVSIVLGTSGSVIASASPDAVARVVRNLIDNAIRHSPAGSSIAVGITRYSDTVKVHVVDEGEGFDADFIPVAFERFTRADDARTRETGGSGLGLAIAGELVAALQGRIWAEPGPGGRVNVELPATVG